MAGSQKFGKPPVVETVIGVQFKEIEAFRSAHVGLYWQSIRDRYPTVSDHSRLEPARERFPRSPIIPGPQLTLLDRPPGGRAWFTADSQSELIQLQPDRFLFNWRRREEPYPTFENNSKTFLEEFGRFCQFCQDQPKLSKPVPEVCEVTYINHIEPLPGESALDLAGRIFTGLRWNTNSAFLPTPESFGFNRVFVIRDGDEPRGRLYAQASIAMRRDDVEIKEFVLLNMTGRVNHASNNENPLAESMQLAHDWVVKGFCDLTDEGIQKERWGLQK